MSRPFYVTTPIYYVNDAPHIGHAYTTILADVLVRYKKLFGAETYFLTGTDEHGQKVQQAAAKRGIDPNDTKALRAYCDGYAQRFKDAWKELEIGYDRFIRTTEKDHVEFVREKFRELDAKGLIYPEEYSGWYSTTEERFFGEDELVNGKDPISGRPVEWITERNYFFRMSNYQQWLIEHIEAHPGFIQPEFRKNEVLGFLRQPLKDLCISRPKSRLAWGVPLPFGDDAYVSYVWVDALLNYVTASKAGRPSGPNAPEWPADLHLIGKDILTTHAVYWPTILMALGLPLPKQILAHGWWLVDNARMSKTTGNVVSPLAMKDKYGVDAFRFFLIRAMIVGQDASFTEEAFVNTINADLANDVGNGLSRVAKLAESLGRELDFPVTKMEVDSDLQAKAQLYAIKAEGYANKVQLSFAVEDALNIFRAVNQYFETTAPWKLAKGTDADKERLKVVLWHAAEALRLGFTLLHPVMPGKMDEALAALGFTIEKSRKALEWRTSDTFSLKPIAPLFPRIETKKPEQSGAGKDAPQAAPSDPFSVIDLRAVKILSVENHPDAEALYVLKVDAGEAEPRTVCAGLRKYLTPDELTNRMAVLVANLKPAKLRGIESHGMLLAADAEKDAEGKTSRLSLAFPENASVGDAVSAQDVERAPKAQITIKDFDKVALVVKSGVVSYGDKPLATAKGPVTAQAPDGAGVR